jgi:ABC-type nickel/cobalt efflux system permease component RcnA
MAFLTILASPLAANPFMGAGSDASGKPAAQISPVRANVANPTLVAKQASLRDRLGDFFYSWKKSGSTALFWGIIGVAFLYGILHALGPGHRKTVIFSLYIAREAPIWEPAGTGLLLSILHGGAAVVLLFIFRGVAGAISGKADNVATYMEGGAYVLLIAIALVLVFQALGDLIRGTPKHANGAASLGTILVTGVYPCPGAILIMILSLTLDITDIGVIAVLAMSLGMSVPVIAAGYLAWFGRTGLFRALKANEAKIGRISAGIELAGYSILLAFSLYMAEPFILSVFRAIGLLAH